MLADDLEAVMQIWLGTNICAHFFIEETYWKNQYDYVKSVRSELCLNVFQKNRNAIRFYQKEGFVKVSESLDENTGEAEFVMQIK